jgi:hypothetical protein
MSQRRWPTIWEWIALYLRLSLSHAPTLKEVAHTAELTDEQLQAQREDAKIHWVKPLERFFGMRPVPDFLSVFLDAAEKVGALVPLPPREPGSKRPVRQLRRFRACSPAQPAESPGLSTSEQSFQVGGEPLSAPPPRNAARPE